MKIVLALEAHEIPPTINIGEVNGQIGLADGHFKIVTETCDWLPREVSQGSSMRVLRAGINSFGYGGANGHVILEGPDAWMTLDTSPKGDPSSQNAIVSERTAMLLPFSATNVESLKARIFSLTALDIVKPNLTDLAYTLGSRRTHFLYRSYAVVHKDSLFQDLQAHSRKPVRSETHQARPTALCYVFTGQGAQWIGMGRELFNEFAVFRHSIRQMNSALQALPSPPTWSLEGLSSICPIHPIRPSSYCYNTSLPKTQSHRISRLLRMHYTALLFEADELPNQRYCLIYQTLVLSTSLHLLSQ